MSCYAFYPKSHHYFAKSTESSLLVRIQYWCTSSRYGYTNSSGVSSPIRTEPIPTATSTANPFQESNDSSSTSGLPNGGVDVGEVEEAEAVDEATKVEI